MTEFCCIRLPLRPRLFTYRQFGASYREDGRTEKQVVTTPTYVISYGTNLRSS